MCVRVYRCVLCVCVCACVHYVYVHLRASSLTLLISYCTGPDCYRSAFAVTTLACVVAIGVSLLLTHQTWLSLSAAPAAAASEQEAPLKELSIDQAGEEVRRTAHTHTHTQTQTQTHTRLQHLYGMFNLLTWFTGAHG